MLKTNDKIIVIGFQTFNCYGMVRSLAQAGIHPELLLSKSKVSFIAKSRYPQSVKFFDQLVDIPQILLEQFVDSVSKPIVICCDDPIQSVVDKAYDRLSEYFLLSNCNEQQSEITRLMDKDIQIEFANKCGLTVPKSWHIPMGAEIPDSIQYPSIAKPYRSISGTKSDIRICYNESQLKTVAGTKDYTVQQFIEKDYEVILWGTSIGGGSYYIPGVARKIRQYPNEWSLSSFGVLEPFSAHPSLDKNKIYTFLRTLKYTGMFSIEMAVKGGKYYFLEINLRNDGKQHFSTVAGANLPLIYIRSLLGEKFEQPQVKFPTYYMGELSDVRHVFKGNLSVLSYIRDLYRKDSFFILNLKDPYPFIYQQLKRFI